jgi:hypothetical protein
MQFDMMRSIQRDPPRTGGDKEELDGPGRLSVTDPLDLTRPGLRI